MAKYRVLPSAAHNYAASFISVTHVAGDDYAMCYLVRAVIAGTFDRVEVNLLNGAVVPAALPAELQESIGAYVTGFGAHVQRSGAALDMISQAVMQLQVARGHVIGRPDPPGVERARIHCVVELTDDRGKVHRGGTSADWICHATRRFY